jgi:hypothetical protein
MQPKAEKERYRKGREKERGREREGKREREIKNDMDKKCLNDPDM